LNVQFAKRRIAISAEAGHVDVKSRPISAGNVEMSAATRRLVLHAVEGNVLFEGLDGDHKKKIVDEMYQIRLARGETAIKEGEPGNNLYVIESGTFDILVRDEVSGRNTKVAERGPGTIFGELALLYNAPRAASVLATSDAVLWVVDRYTFRSVGLLTTTLSISISIMLHLLSFTSLFAHSSISLVLCDPSLL
jgi:CRP-like cAMP-binding protein